MSQPITAENVWDIIQRIDRRCYMASPFFLILNCTYEEQNGEPVIFYKWSDYHELVHPTKNPVNMQNQYVWCFQADIDRIRAQGLEIKSIEEGVTEYFYNTKDLVDLDGQDYKKIRYKVNMFKKNYVYETHTTFDPAATKELIHRWYKRTARKKEGEQLEVLKNETAMSLDIVDMLPTIPQAKGLYVTVGGVLVGVTIFCPLYDDFWVSMIQKTDFKYDGLSRFMYQEKCRMMLKYPTASFSNDAGDEAVRATKMDLRPARIEPYFLVETGFVKK